MRPFESLDDFPLEAHWMRRVNSDHVIAIGELKDDGVVDRDASNRPVLLKWSYLANHYEFYLNKAWRPFANISKTTNQTNED